MPETLITDAVEVEIIAEDDTSAVQIIAPLPAPTFDPDAVAITHDAYDEDSQTWVAVTEQMISDEKRVFEAIRFSKHLKSAAIKHAFDNNLHLAAGYRTKTAYCQNHLGITRRNANQCYADASAWDLRLTTLLPEHSTSANAEKREYVFPHDAEDDVRAAVQSLAISKLRELRRLPDEQQQEFLASGEVRLENGEVLSVEDIDAMSQRKLKALLDEKLKPHKQRREEAEARAQKAEAEAEFLRRRNTQLEEQVENARELEAHFGPAANKLKQKRILIARANEESDELNKTMNKLGVTAGDPIGLLHDLSALLSKQRMHLEHWESLYAEARYQHIETVS